MRRAALAVGVVAAVGLFVPVRVDAAESCSTVVFDAAGVLGSRRGAVEQAAAGLTRLGAVVRVRAMTRVPGADLDAWMAEAESRCPDWRAGGVRKPSLVVLAVATEDRKTGLWYGSRWRPALDGRWEALQVEHMNPLFKEGEFAAGLSAGLVALAEEIASPVSVAPGPVETTTTVYRDVVRRPVYDDEPERYPGSGWDDGGQSFPAEFIALMVIVGVAGVALQLVRAGGSAARGRRSSGWVDDGPTMHSGWMGGSSSSSSGGSSWSGSSGGGDFGGDFGGGSSGGGSGGGGSTSW